MFRMNRACVPQLLMPHIHATQQRPHRKLSVWRRRRREANKWKMNLWWRFPNDFWLAIVTIALISTPFYEFIKLRSFYLPRRNDRANQPKKMRMNESKAEYRESGRPFSFGFHFLESVQFLMWRMRNISSGPNRHICEFGFGCCWSGVRLNGPAPQRCNSNFENGTIDLCKPLQWIH